MNHPIAPKLLNALTKHDQVPVEHRKVSLEMITISSGDNVGKQVAELRWTGRGYGKPAYFWPEALALFETPEVAWREYHRLFKLNLCPRSATLSRPWGETTVYRAYDNEARGEKFWHWIEFYHGRTHYWGEGYCDAEGLLCIVLKDGSLFARGEI